MKDIKILNEVTLRQLNTIILKSLANTDYEAFIFGSWVNGTARDNSDIDLGIYAPNNDMNDDILQNLTEELLNSDIPYFTEVVNFNIVSKEFNDFARTKIIQIKNHG